MAELEVRPLLEQQDRDPLVHEGLAQAASTASASSATWPRARVGGRRLDHHAHHRLGARRAHQHPPVVAELGFDVAHPAQNAVSAESSASRSSTRTLRSTCG